MTTVNETLAERDKLYGGFVNNSRLTQSIKECFRGASTWNEQPCDSREALDQIAHKISRILSTTLEKADSWHDIAGYAVLVEQRIIKETKDVSGTEDRPDFGVAGSASWASIDIVAAAPRPTIQSGSTHITCDKCGRVSKRGERCTGCGNCNDCGS